MISPRTRTLLLRIFVFVVVMLIGALLFMATEGKHETSEAQYEDYKTLINISSEDYDLLVDAIRNDTSSSRILKLRWTFGNSLYFVLVLITTIGKLIFFQKTNFKGI